jgi:hypothetical protein
MYLLGEVPYSPTHFDPEGGSSMDFRNVGNSASIHTVQRPNKPERKPEVSNNFNSRPQARCNVLAIHPDKICIFRVLSCGI